MLKLTRLSDYAAVIMAYMSTQPFTAYSANAIAQYFGLPQPTVSKVLKLLQRARLLVSKRGASGGYQLAYPAENIAISTIIEAIEGPIAITLCQTQSKDCQLQTRCGLSRNWKVLSNVIHQLLSHVSLAQLADQRRLSVAFNSDVTIKNGRFSQGEQIAIG